MEVFYIILFFNTGDEYIDIKLRQDINFLPARLVIEV